MVRMDQRITLQSKTLAADGIGGQPATWANLTTTPSVWAHVIAKSGREMFEEGRVNATNTFIFTIRNRSDLDETMRIVWAGSNYNIRSILRMGGRKLYLQIEAERGV